MRLALDLGLHLSVENYVQIGQMTAEEARVRRITFWGTFAIDRCVFDRMKKQRSFD